MKQHNITQRHAPTCVLVMCSCGWQRQFKRENALARAAKVRKAIRAHYQQVEGGAA